jgi:hypothetical protein
VETEPHRVAPRTFHPSRAETMAAAPIHQFIGEEIGAIVRFEPDRNFLNDLDITAMVAKAFPHGLGKRCHHLFTDGARRLRRNGKTTVHPISANFLAYLPTRSSHARNSSRVIGSDIGPAAAALISSTISGGTSPRQNGQPQSSSMLVAPSFYRNVE